MSVMQSLFKTTKDYTGDAYFAPVMTARKKYGKSKIKHLLELWSYCRKNNFFPRTEYYKYGFHKIKNLDFATASSFIGIPQFHKLAAELDDKHSTSRKIMDDKILSELAFHQAGLPTVKTIATFGVPQVLSEAKRLDKKESILAFFRESGNSSLFGKPPGGSKSNGILNIAQACDANGYTVFADGRKLPADAVAEAISSEFPNGYIFQERIVQHPQVRALSGDSVSTIRVVVLWTEHGPTVLHSVWKLASPSSLADNSWRSGVSMCLLDPESGEIRRAAALVNGVAEEVVVHGKDQTPLIGMSPPHWEAARDLSRRAAAEFPGVVLTGWDIAIGPLGPMIVEANFGPSPLLYQVSAGRGLRTPEFEKQLASARRLLEKRSKRTLSGRSEEPRGKFKKRLDRLRQFDVWNLIR